MSDRCAILDVAEALDRERKARRNAEALVMALAALIVQRNWQTSVPRECDSACTLANGHSVPCEVKADMQEARWLDIERRIATIALDL